MADTIETFMADTMLPAHPKRFTVSITDAAAKPAKTAMSL